ncbi:MAG: 5-dehydro-2-deoxygluconokinase [Caldilineales bacterium]|nr:5-dehydro-2-deoxygluconokinase [Caldilineales bacterium]MDW8316712.1 5-dehydro-2-deoxygluconokinase [Anaerolineae bacterium]
MAKTYDLLTMGRSSIDLYANDIGVPFVEIKSFAAYVGGCPTNIAVGARRLGLRTALLTAVGEDRVGDFVLHFLQREGVETRFIPRKPGHRTSAVVLGIEGPDRFPLTFYRDNCADIELTIDDVRSSPVEDCRVLLITGTGLSREPSRSATLYAAEIARAAGATVMIDLDFRPDQWDDPRAYAVNVRSALRLVHIALGTEDEINAAMLSEAGQVSLTNFQVSDARVTGDVEASVAALLGVGPQVLLQKRGKHGARVHLVTPQGVRRSDVPGFPVEVFTILGAGDAFAAGAIYGYLQGWDWYKAVRLANACGAIVVTKHGCANFTPTMAEVEAFVAAQGGW